MAELADALDSGSSDRKVMEVQVLLAAPVGVFLQHLSVVKTPFYYTAILAGR